MKIVSTTDELINLRKELKGSIGFVPTMGALHNGHLSLIRKSLEQNDITIVSIFVNPTQFLPGEDLDKYPKRTEADLKICSLAGVDVVFMPNIDDMYFQTEPIIQAPMNKSYILEGLSRPGHFDGVLRVVLKLFNLTRPDYAYFGKKDAQQLYLIQNMVKTLFLGVEIIPCEIVREEDGLALSSRNVYLSKIEREESLKLSKALKRASRQVMQKEYDSKIIETQMLLTLEPLHVEYAKVLNREFEPIQKVEIGNTLIAIAAKLGQTRLIDNIWI